MGTPYVILATGQSNIQLTRSYSWSPNARAKVWNNIVDAESGGTAFTALSSSNVDVASSYASKVADNNPSYDVYLIRIGQSARDILSWVGGGNWNVGGAGVSGNVYLNSGSPSSVTEIIVNVTDALGIARPYGIANQIINGKIWIKKGAGVIQYRISAAPTYTAGETVFPVVYESGSASLSGAVQIEFLPRFINAIDNIVPPALSAAGVSKIDTVLWWQGESDAQYNTNYENEFNFFHGYMQTSRLFYTGSKLLICGTASTATTGMAWQDTFNSRLAALAAAQPGVRYFGNLAANISAPRWIETYHMDAQGYYDSGVYLAGVYPASGSIIPPTTTGNFNVRNAANTGWIDMASATGVRIRNASNTGWISKSGPSLTGFQIRNQTNDGWITTGPYTPPVEVFGDLSLYQNDLDFRYAVPKTSASSLAYSEIIFTVDTTNFFNHATGSDDHVVFCLDSTGTADTYYGGTRKHCGAITRYSSKLFDQGRGFIIKRDGHLWFEHWVPGKPVTGPGSPIGAILVDNGFSFNPLTYPVFTIVIKAGYRVGTWGEKMDVNIYNGTTTGGTLLTGFTASWGWDYSGTHNFCLGGISGGFVAPASTGCVEKATAGPAVGAVILVSNYSFVTKV